MQAKYVVFSRLAALYDNGKIVHRDAERAYRLFDEAGAKGDTHAAVRAPHGCCWQAMAFPLIERACSGKA
jgi:TPR repeat protein